MLRTFLPTPQYEQLIVHPSHKVGFLTFFNFVLLSSNGHGQISGTLAIGQLYVQDGLIYKATYYSSYLSFI